MAKTRPMTAAKKPPCSNVRIIGGEYRSRLINFLPIDGLRPTPDRVRETVFNWLDDHIVNTRVLDCCAGSGVLGMEAISRGAAFATLIEKNHQQAHQLVQIKQQLNIAEEKISIIQGDVLTVLASFATPFDIVFIDPPYASQLWQPILSALLSNQLVHINTLIYLEADKPMATVLPNLYERLVVIKSKKIGQIYVEICQLSDANLC